MTENEANDSNCPPSIPLAPELRAEIEQYRLKMQSEAPPGTVVTTQDALRELLKKGIAMIEAEDASLPS